jgi:hypothetical protein
MSLGTGGTECGMLIQVPHPCSHCQKESFIQYHYGHGMCLHESKAVKLGMVVHACNANTWEAEVGGLQILDQPELHS